MGYRDIEVKATMNVEVADIPTMREMGGGEAYLSYLREALFFVDHHDVLRSTLGEWPIAATKEQVQALIRYLQAEVLPRHE